MSIIPFSNSKRLWTLSKRYSLGINLVALLVLFKFSLCNSLCKIELEELSKSLFDNRIIKISCDNKLDILLDDKYYEQLSGGEQRKCDIGLIIAQRKLAQKMKSVSSNILIMDEIFDGLDDVSFNIVLDLLSDEMQDVEDNIIISHRNIEEIPFDHKIEVIKNENNISEVNFY